MKSKKKFLLIPAMPTPNGRLHLGHIGGPFLKMDILARSLNRNGDSAKVISSSDIYESYVLLKSYQTKMDVYKVCNHFHKLIEDDLKALMIDCDYFNPLDNAYKKQVDDMYLNTMEALSKTKSYYRRNEKVFYSSKTDKYIVGTWIRGNCPHCQNDAGSYLCEVCGMQFNPEDFKETKPTLGETDIKEKNVNTFFLKIKNIKKLLNHITSMGTRLEFFKIIERYLDFYKGEVRITNPGNWGVKWGNENLEGKNYHVVFPYTGLFSLSRVCGALYSKEMNLDRNPFEKGSEVTTIASFGIDSTIPWFVGVLGSAIESNTFKPFDYLLTNHFYKLEGSKFSTSRLHVIWAGDIVNKTKAKSDSIRFYLAKNHPKDKETDFNISDFIHFNNSFLVKEFDIKVQKLLYQLLETKEVKKLPSNLNKDLMLAVKQQANLLMPPTQNLNKAVEFSQNWFLKTIKNEDWLANPYWLLKSLSLFFFPIMPEISETIWKALGNTGAPTNKNFNNINSLEKLEIPTSFFEILDYNNLLPCLPKTIIEKQLKFN
ncbi:class I tRNA ligase family protein [Flavivirga jejuensis]|uniref:Class I tRNA ligase family protein n=1 Tax=Flavivirga jejuensis TaxID=870487 RepID=A0ABT8WU11_9FLAO|nr:class I tRNA ligase family protein [Flavivirga jejuensis]MDO5976362.1 class I tRNA ligase family protein [Flavivirga jejuensis]